jgi:phosphate transport system substrate-binding protein
VNPGVNFPNQEIVVVHRSDGSGTTFVWTDYLSKVSNDWKNQVGADTSVKWPKGLGGKGNDGVAGSIRQLPGSIGYIELIYAVQNKIAFGSVKNSSGAFIKASLDGVTAAAASAPKMPADFRVSITNAPGKDAYPISSFTWLLIPQASKDSAKGKILADFLNWMIADGQKMAGALDYAPLPDNVAAKVKETIKQVK